MEREHLGPKPKTFGTFDARVQLGRLLDRVERGERLTITRNDRPVATLAPVVPPGERTLSQAGELREQFRFFRQAHPLPDVTTRELIEEGRKR